MQFLVEGDYFIFYPNVNKSYSNAIVSKSCHEMQLI